MNEATLMGVLDGLTEMDHQLDPGLPVGLLILHPGVQGDSVDELHGDEGQRAVLGLGTAGLVDLGDPGVLKVSQEGGFMGESPPQLIGGQLGANDLEGHTPLWILLLSLVDHAHAALADDAQGAITTDPGR